MKPQINISQAPSFSGDLSAQGLAGPQNDKEGFNSGEITF